VKLRKIVSGGQTGVDRGALDAAMATGTDAGGWCPRGRLAEDGVIPRRYPVNELDSEAYADRTERNVIDSDGTLVLNLGELADGTLHTVELAKSHEKPVIVLQMEQNPDPAAVVSWLTANRIGVLNVAGPRESKRPGVGAAAYDFIRRLVYRFENR
jgi:hypothetical protein